MREKDLIDRVESALVFNLVNRVLAESARIETAQRAVNMVDVRKWRHDWRRKYKTMQDVTEALRVVK